MFEVDDFIMLYKNRDRFRKASLFIGNKFSFLSPDHWTFLSLVCALISAYLIASYEFAYAALLFALAAFLDATDGAVARYRNAVTPRGAFYDTIADRYVELAVIISFALLQLPDFVIPAKIWIILLLFGSMMTTYARAAAKRELGVEAKGGIVERAERMILLFAGILSAIASIAYLMYFIAILAVLSNVSAVQRIRIALSGKR